MCVFHSAHRVCFYLMWTEPHLMLNVGMYSLQHPLTRVLIRQIRLNLKMAHKHIIISIFCIYQNVLLAAATSLFILIAINRLFSLLISTDECFHCQNSTRPNHSVSLLGNSLGCICIPIDHPLL